jgi:hypothetical protein
MTVIQNLIHFDSASASYNVSPNSSSITTATNPYNASYPLVSPLAKVRRIQLQSVEIPIAFPNIRSGSTNILKMTVDGTSYTILVDEGLYSTTTTLMTAINTAVALAITSNTPVFSVNTTNSYLIDVTSSATSLSFTQTNLSQYILGIRSDDSFSSSVLYLHRDLTARYRKSTYMLIPCNGR